MSRFNYKARDKSGDLTEDEIDASSRHEATEKLISKGLIPVSVEETAAVFNPSVFFLEMKRPKLRDLALFFRQMSVMVIAGLPFFEGLKSVEKQTTNRSLRKTIAGMRADIEGGSSFSESLRNHRAVFSSLTVAMVEAGERSGSLGDTMQKISEMIEKDDVFSHKIKTALRYPSIVLTVLLVAFVLATVFIIPRFAGIFKAFGGDLPLPTKILLEANRIVISYWYIVLIAAAALYFMFIKYINLPAGKRRWDSFLLRIPVFGDLRKKIALARFFRIFSNLLSSGIQISSALELTENTADNAEISDILLRVKKAVTEGSSMSDAMEKFPIFPPISVQMIALGEKSGELAGMLAKNSVYFDEETDYIISNMMVLIEPMVIMILAGFVLLLALGVFLPTWNSMNLYFK